MSYWAGETLSSRVAVGRLYLVWGVPSAVAAARSLLPRGCQDEVHSGAVIPGPRVCLHIPDSVGLQPVGMELPGHIRAQLSRTMMYMTSMAVLSRMCTCPPPYNPLPTIKQARCGR